MHYIFWIGLFCVFAFILLFIVFSIIHNNKKLAREYFSTGEKLRIVKNTDKPLSSYKYVIERKFCNIFWYRPTDDYNYYYEFGTIEEASKFINNKRNKWESFIYEKKCNNSKTYL